MRAAVLFLALSLGSSTETRMQQMPQLIFVERMNEQVNDVRDWATDVHRWTHTCTNTHALLS